MAMVDQREVLWQAYAARRELEVRNRILLEYAPIVKYILHRMFPGKGHSPDFEDLSGYGILGLLDAIDKYDPDRGVKFETYASLRVKGAIIDQLRKQDWVPRGVRSKVKMIQDCYSRLESNLGRPATDLEVADTLRIPVDELQQRMDAAHSFNILSLDEQLIDAVLWENQDNGQQDIPEDAYEGKELNDYLADQIDQLSDKERLVVTLYYHEELTLKEIGLTLGVSESRVSQIHSKAILKLKIKLERYMVPV